MTHRQIESSRETRLWITQVLIPILGVVMLFPEAREVVKTKGKEIGDKLKSKLHK